MLVDLDLEALLDSMLDALVVIDNENRVALMNKAAEALYAVTRAEAIGRPVSLVRTWRFDTSEAEAAANLALQTVGSWRGDFSHQLPDGRVVEVETSISVLRGPTGERLGRISVIRDIGERRVAQRDQRFIDGLHDALTRERLPHTLLATVLPRLAEHLGGRVTWHEVNDGRANGAVFDTERITDRSPPQ